MNTCPRQGIRELPLQTADHSRELVRREWTTR
jgi:hypothetical protein